MILDLEYLLDLRFQFSSDDKKHIDFIEIDTWRLPSRPDCTVSLFGDIVFFLWSSNQSSIDCVPDV